MDTQNQQQTGNDQGGQDQKTFTQEEVNNIVKERLRKESSKYDDYEALKEKAKKLDELEEAGKSELEKATKKNAELQAQIDSFKKQGELRELREKVAKEVGVPAELLTGDTEETCKEHAKAILEFAKKGKYPDVPDGGEPPKTGGGTKTRDQFADWFNSTMK